MPQLTFTTRTKFLIYMHPRDWYNAGDDAKILLSAAPASSEIFVFGRPGDDERLKRSLEESSSALLLFPDASAVSVEEFLDQKQGDITADISAPGVTAIVVIDGTWNNVKQMQKHFTKEVAPSVPHVKLMPTSLSVYARTQTRKDGISSVEAVSRCAVSCDAIAALVTALLVSSALNECDLPASENHGNALPDLIMAVAAQSSPSSGALLPMAETPVFSSVGGRSAGSNPGRQRLYIRWPGKSRFCCGGYCVTGGEDECPVACLGGISCASIATWLCVLIPCAVYFAVALPHVVRYWKPQPALLLPLVSAALFLATVVLLLATCCSDPGIIPRRHLVIASGSQARITALLGHDLLGPEGVEPSGEPLEDAEKMVSDDLRQRGYRWCQTCQIVRPPRASHCRDCDHC
ncbi:unnamed protein product, partial [Polarella glacialis]